MVPWGSVKTFQLLLHDAPDPDKAPPSGSQVTKYPMLKIWGGAGGGVGDADGGGGGGVVEEPVGTQLGRVVHSPLLTSTTVQTWQLLVTTLGEADAVGLMVCAGSAVKTQLPVDEGSG